MRKVVSLILSTVLLGASGCASTGESVQSGGAIYLPAVLHGVPIAPQEVDPSQPPVLESNPPRCWPRS